MAKDKKSVLIYVDWISIFDELSDEEAGKLVKHLFRYVNDKNPEAPDRLTKLLFEPIKQTLKRDLVNYESTCNKNKENALIRWNKLHAVASDGIKVDAKHADSDSDSDSDSDIINTWRKDYNIYITECKEAYRIFMENADLLKEQQRLNPGINVRLSIEKGYLNFWGTEAGWKHKKKSRSKEIDWHRTIINSIGINKVYFTKEELTKC